MSDRQITVMPDPDALAATAADAFIEIVQAAVVARGSALVTVAGGQTPRMMNELLAASPRRERLDWMRVTFFFGDERCVPPDDAESNYRMTRESLLDPLTISAERVFRLRGEDEPHAAADAYQRTLQQFGETPKFDLVLLGMGPDGHTASLFPGTIEALDLQRNVVANFVPKLDAYRLTLTPRILNAARAVIITAAKAEKADSLRAVLEGPSDPNRYPAQLIAPACGVRWLVDAAAASKLSAPR